MIDQLLQFILAGLLTLTIIWCVLVHQKLRRLSAPTSEIAGFVESLTRATDRANDVLNEIKEASEAAETSLVHQEKRLQAKLDRVARFSRSMGGDERPGYQSPDGSGENTITSRRKRNESDGSRVRRQKRREPDDIKEVDGDVISPKDRAAELMRALQGLR